MPDAPEWPGSAQRYLRAPYRLLRAIRAGGPPFRVNSVAAPDHFGQRGPAWASGHSFHRRSTDSSAGKIGGLLAGASGDLRCIRRNRHPCARPTPCDRPRADVASLPCVGGRTWTSRLSPDWSPNLLSVPVRSRPFLPIPVQWLPRSRLADAPLAAFPPSTAVLARCRIAALPDMHLARRHLANGGRLATLPPCRDGIAGSIYGRRRSREQSPCKQIVPSCHLALEGSWKIRVFGEGMARALAKISSMEATGPQPPTMNRVSR